MDQLDGFEQLRIDTRSPAQLRPVNFIRDFAPAAAGSVLIEMGNTRVICGVSIENRIPIWMRQQNVKGGWLTAEYSMLPYSTTDRNRREAGGKVGGRTMEIQRLIGRSLRAAVDLKKIGERTIWVDCDVLQADGGTRTASITGGYVALKMAIDQLLGKGVLKADPMVEQIAAISVGVVNGLPLLDLCYEEDVRAAVDMNMVMTGSGKFIEVQGTAEASPFSSEELQEMLQLAEKGIRELFKLQRG